MKLDLTRGKPSAEQLDLAKELLTPARRRRLQGRRRHGQPQLRRPAGAARDAGDLRAVLQVPAAQLIAAGNSSLELMHDASCTRCSARCRAPSAVGRRGAGRIPRARPGLRPPLRDVRALGIEHGLGADDRPRGPTWTPSSGWSPSDPAIKGIWCVPKYSQPDGRGVLATRRPAAGRHAGRAPDFRILWDNAYAVHHLTDEPDPDRRPARAAPRPATPTACSSSARRRRSPSRARGSRSSARRPRTSRGCSAHEQADHRAGQDQPAAPRDVPARHRGVAAHMRAPRDPAAPKFAAVERILDRELGGTGLASLDHAQGRLLRHARGARRLRVEVVRLAKEAGIALTPGCHAPVRQGPARRDHPVGPDVPACSMRWRRR